MGCDSKNSTYSRAFFRLSCADVSPVGDGGGGGGGGGDAAHDGGVRGSMEG